MSTTGDSATDKTGKFSEARYNYGLEDDPVDYVHLEQHLDELDLSPTHYETMEEKHRRQGEDMLRFLEFERNLDESQLGLSDRERHLLFLKEEGRHDKEQRRLYLLFLRYERQHWEGKREA
jgi:hypothetical protein